jgi:leader peptidase (prepilin peptidase)/N-methyltransferase
MSTVELTPAQAPAHDWQASPRLRSPWLISLTVAGAVAAAAIQGSVVYAALCGLLVLVLVPCTVIDLQSRIIPNLITGPAAVMAIVLGTVLDPAGEPHRFVWAAGAGGFLLVTALISPGGMGMGDVKLLAVMGLCLGSLGAVALFAALIAQVVAAAVLAVRHGVRAARKTTVPFGPYLAGGGVLMAIAGSGALHSSLHLVH